MLKLKPIIGRNPFKKITSAVIGVGMDAAALLVKRDFEQQVKTWKTKPVFTIERDGDDRRSVITDDEIFLYQDLGTKAHIIRPKKKRALAWPGGRHPVKMVRHPGTKAQHFTKAVQAKAPARMLNAMNDAIQEVTS